MSATGVKDHGLFLKASSSLIGPSEGVAIRFPDRRTDHEAELGVVIGRKTGFVSEAEALSVVAGYAIALDMVVRGKEDGDLVPALVGGLIINVPRQISWASSVYTLYPGDIIMSGTCQGVSPVQPGDIMSLSFERIGDMTVPIRA